MKMKIIENYFEQPENFEEEINKVYNVTQSEVDEMVKMLKDWLKQQPHLPLEEDEVIDHKLKRILRGNKMSLQKSKEKLDNYYSVKSIFSEFFTDNAPLSPNIQTNLNIGGFMVIKKPYGHARIVYAKFFDRNVENFNYLDTGRVMLQGFELANIYDFCLGAIAIIDCGDLTMGHIMSVDLKTGARQAKLVEKAYSDAVKAVHYINCPSFVANLVNFFKKLHKEKIAERIHVHENHNSLFQFIPKEFIAKDYGGDYLSLKEIHSEWRKFVEANNEVILNQAKNKSNEKLRPGKPLDMEHFGIEGSFRKLELD